MAENKIRKEAEKENREKSSLRGFPTGAKSQKNGINDKKEGKLETDRRGKQTDYNATETTRTTVRETIGNQKLDRKQTI